MNLTRKLSIGTFGVSVLLHLAVFLMVSGWVLIQAVTPKVIPSAAVDAADNQSAEMPPELPEDEAMPELASGDPQDTPEQPQTVMPTDTITANAPSASFNLPVSVGLYVPGAAVNSGPAPGGGSSRAAAALGKAVTTGNIFGTQVEAGKLCVILDVSGSAHPYLPEALEDIQKNFANAVIVFAFGCGMKPDPKFAEHVKVLPFRRAELPYRSGQRTTLSQIKMAMREPQNEKIFKRLKGRDAVYYVDGGDVGATQAAFVEAAKQGVDTVFWFADFEDPIQGDPTTTAQVLAEMKSHGIKVYVNNFSGKEKNVGMKFATELAKGTGGTVTCQAK